MPRRRPYGSYPALYHQWFLDAHRGDTVSVLCHSSREATNLRATLYEFRQSIRNGGPDPQLFDDLTLEVDGRHLNIKRRRDHEHDPEA